MDSHTLGTFDRLEIVETGRRRRWSEDEKVRIVLESMAGPRLVAPTARRHNISRSMLCPRSPMVFSQALINKLALLEAQASRLLAEVANEDAEHAPAPPLERKQVEAALATIGANLHLIFDEDDDRTIVDLKESVRGMIGRIVVVPQGGAPPRAEMHGRFAGMMSPAGLLGATSRPYPRTRTALRLSTKGGCFGGCGGTQPPKAQ